jgi:undecaprenyl-phosphate galactose phosphotransferase
MVVNSKEVLEHVLATDIEAKKEWDATFKLKKTHELLKLVIFFVGRVLMNFLSYLMY